MTLSLPPAYVSLPIEIIEQAYRPDKPHRAVFATFVRLLSLAWANQYEHTPMLREEELYNTKNADGSTKYGFLKLERRQYFEQKREMEGMVWLRSTHPKVGFVQFSFTRPVKDTASKTDECEKSHLGAENRTTAPIVVVVKESTDSELSIETTTPILNGEASAENRTSDNGEGEPFLPSVERILAHTSLLFNGAVVMSQGLEDRDPRDVLRWCAYVYSQKHTMTAPGGVVRNKLKWNEKPPEWTADKWFETLPDPFLEAIGLKTDIDDEPQEVGPEPVYFEVPDFSKAVVVGSHTQNDVASVAWQATKTQLQLQMARNPFELYVQDTQAVCYDRNTLTIGVANQDAADWLESRLTSTVERLLVGILNCEVTVVFAAPTLVESE